MAAAIDYIPVSPNKALGQNCIAVARQLQNVIADINRLKGNLDHLTDGTTDFTKIELQLGLSVGDGTKVYSLITTLQTQVNGSAAVNGFANQVQSST